jgi:hypothetical protein
MAPGMVSDEVFIDGLPVGSFFSFVWNAVISMSLGITTFVLTYLLHTTHAAKNGSRVGLGITLIKYGFDMRSSVERSSNGNPAYGQPADPNSHDFDPSAVANAAAAAVTTADDAAAAAAEGWDGFPGQEWFSYALLIVGWIVLIKSVSDFVKARRHEQLVLQSPDRGLNVPVVAEGEHPETVA